MPESLRREKDSDNDCEKKSPEAEKTPWTEDQKRRPYYYDDAHGYEIYNPEDERDEEDENYIPAGTQKPD